MTITGLHATLSKTCIATCHVSRTAKIPRIVVVFGLIKSKTKGFYLESLTNFSIQSCCYLDVISIFSRVCDLATRHSILKSSSRFVSNRQQNVTPRVKFVLDESFGKETTPSEECIQQNVNRMFPARISKENVSRDLFPKINLKKFTH